MRSIGKKAKAKVKVTRRSPKGESTRSRILDAAETLFAASPYDAVSQRDVALQANILTGLVTHHYPNKISLFDAVTARRARELNDVRLVRLQSLDQPDTGAVVDAFFQPLIELVSSGKPGWTAYSRLMCTLVYSDAGIEINSRYFRDIARTFLAALSKAVPQLDRLTLAHAFLYSIDVVLTSLFVQHRVEQLVELDVDQTTKERDFHNAYRTIRPFVLGGISALVAESGAAKKRSAKTRPVRAARKVIRRSASK